MNNLSKKNLLSMLCVFSFVAFGFAIANSFGDTYAVETEGYYKCSDGYKAMAYAGGGTYCCPSSHSSGFAAFAPSSNSPNGLYCKSSDFDAFSSIDEIEYQSGVGTYFETVQYIISDRIWELGKNLCEEYSSVCTIDEFGVVQGKSNWNCNKTYVSDTISAIQCTNLVLVRANEAILYYDLTFDNQGGTGQIGTVSMPAGSSYILKEPSKNGFTFGGWRENNIGVERIFAAGESISVSSNRSFSAIWKSDSSTTEKIVVTYNYNYGSFPPTSKQYNASESFTLFVPNEREGYDFVEWNTKSDGTGTSYNLVDYYSFNNSITLYAIWEEDTSLGGNPGTPTTPIQDTFIITFDANDGTLNGKSTDSCNTTTGSCDITSLPTATRNNYEFNGWGTSKTCTSGKKDKITLTGNATYYACWVDEEEDGDDPVTKYSVTFNANGGKLYVDDNLTNVMIYKLEKIDYSKFKAKKEDFIFKGWRTSTGTCKDAKIAISETLTKNLNLVACYEAIESDISDNPNTGSSLLYVVYLIGILALCYTGYYAYCYSKNRK